MKRHADFLATLYLTWGAVFTLVALAGFALAGGAAAIATSGGPAPVATEVAARLTAISIGVVAAIALVWGALHLWVGAALGRRRASARLMAIGLAVGNLVLLPFGTALGAYACWVLLKDEGRDLFQPS